MKYEEIKNLKDEYPDSEVLIHPECACGSQAMAIAEKNNDKSIHFLSTEAMVNKSKAELKAATAQLSEIAIKQEAEKLKIEEQKLQLKKLVVQHKLIQTIIM